MKLGVVLFCSGVVGLISCTQQVESTQCFFSTNNNMPVIDVKRASLLNGTASGEFLAISDQQKQSIGRIWQKNMGPSMFCTGVLIAKRWVLTSRHCDLGGPIIFEIPGNSHLMKSSVGIWANAIHDALLIELDGDVPAATIPVIQETLDGSLENIPVLLAGYGDTANGQPSRQLLFLVEPVTNITKNKIHVSGFGRTGACTGDSGGPLLIRDTKGRLVVAGILSAGKAKCNDLDIYIRTDVLNTWITSLIGEYQPADEKCDQITTTGFCRYGSAIWCENGNITSQKCSDDTVCGWSSEWNGYRCITMEQDMCKGLGDLGICQNGTAYRCEKGRILEFDCDACDLSCQHNNTTGLVNCL